MKGPNVTEPPELPKSWEDAYEASEMRRLVRLGLKDEALRRARETLEQESITVESLHSALEAILLLDRQRRSWARLVESAYRRLADGQFEAVAFVMRAFWTAPLDREDVPPLAPRRLGRELALLGLGSELQAALDSGEAEAAKRLANRLLRPTCKAANRWLRSQLQLCLVEVLKRDGMWEEALWVLEMIEDERTLANAVTDVVEAHVVWAEMILNGVRSCQQDEGDWDSEGGNRPDETDYPCSVERSKELDRIQRLLQEIIPEERRKSLGID